MIERDLTNAANREYDLILVGGGIQGCALALEAARRGLRPVLLEKGDFGGATTWNCLRILHGGLRYLQTGDLTRFFRSVQERSWFLSEFPDLTQPLPCLMPLYGKGLKRKPLLRLALGVNDLLSARRNRNLPQGQRILSARVLSRQEALDRFPGAQDEAGLMGAARWHDGLIQSTPRLVMEILRWASACGAVCLNYVAARRLLEDPPGKVAGVEAEDLESGEALRLRGRFVLNCAGPWCAEWAERAGYPAPGLFSPSLAFNLLLDMPAPARDALAATPSDDPRFTYFLLPWRGRTLAGTWHAPWDEGTADAGPSEEQIAAFLERLNACPGIHVQRRQVLNVLAGLQPSDAKSRHLLAVRDVFHDHAASGGPQGFVSLCGIKFTTARRTAEDALRRLSAKAGRPLPPVGRITRPTPLPWLGFEEFERLSAQDPSAAKGILQRFRREESARCLDDLILRRLDWGLDPRQAEAARGLAASMIPAWAAAKASAALGSGRG